MSSHADTTLVLAWPIADPKQRLHLGGKGWSISGRALCGESIKRAAEEADLNQPMCTRCEAAADE